MNRIANFIDGGYLDALLKNEWKSVIIDYKQLTGRMSQGHDLLRSYYYHCPPYEVEDPADWQKEFYDERTSFFRKLEDVPRFENRLGQLQYRGKDQRGHPIYEQKRVDLMFGVDLVMLATKGLITHASILAGDSDFIPALNVIKSEGVVVHLFCGKTPHDDLRSIVDEVTVMDKAFIQSVSVNEHREAKQPQGSEKKQKPVQQKARNNKNNMINEENTKRKTSSNKKFDLSAIIGKKKNK